MVTLVGTQNDFSDALAKLVELEHDAIAAHLAAIEHLKDEAYKKRLSEFIQDHKNSILEFSEILVKHGSVAPKSPDIKQYLLKAKIISASMLGDKAVLKAVKDNQKDINTAYEKIFNHIGKWQDAIDTVDKGLTYAKNHQVWLDTIV